ncbi:MAG: solute:sodium symporter family transporter [Sedimentisphaerales bacterium]|nr:solute:sodium symporter family transporter [Sedimentisphaerales bacterium]
MDLNALDITLFVGFIAAVVALSMYKSRKEETGEDFFLAGRGLTWPLIGFSLIAANISTEQFVGMNGQAAGNVGLAVASYDWIAAISLVLVAIFFLPFLLRGGIYTIPEYLEHRYNTAARGIMSIYMMIILVAVTMAAVLYSGGLTLRTIFGLDLRIGVWLIGGIAALYTTWGGLKAVAWADLIQCSALLLGGLCVTIAGLMKVGGLDAFYDQSAERLHMALPANHPSLPWTALLFGIWIPNLYYWGFNQYIVQRSLAAKSLKHGQLGVLLAAGLQVVLPLIVVIPGIIAIQLYEGQLADTPDAAFPLLIRNLIPGGLRGFILAAIAGAVISSLASMLNSASTIFTIDIFKRHWKKDASPHSIVTVGRIMTLLFVVIGCSIAPVIDDPKYQGVFYFIQDFQGYVTPGILACFIFGFFVKRTPAAAAITGLLLNVPVYGILHISPAFLDKLGVHGKWHWLDQLAVSCGNMAFLNKMALTFSAIAVVMAAITLAKPLKEPKQMPVNPDFDMKPAPSVVAMGATIVAVTVLLYVIFW